VVPKSGRWTSTLRCRPAKAAAGCHAGAAVLLHGRRARGGTIEFRAAVKAEKAARGAQPEEEERTDGELNWVQRARLASEVAAQKHRVGGKKATRGGPT
jgi:hypothetical protein